MSNGTSDLIPDLQLDSPLDAGDQYTSHKHIAAHYSGLVVNVFTDTAVDITLAFSGDGINWDVQVIKSLPLSTWTPPIPTDNFLNTAILCKWVRLTVKNTDVSDQTLLRVRTYGTPTFTGIS